MRAGGLIKYERSSEIKSIRGDGPPKREVFHFSNSGRALAGHLQEISSVLAGDVLWKRNWKRTAPVNPFAILSISLTAIKVMSYEIDCPHKIVSSPFVVWIAYTVLGSTKQMTASPLYSACDIIDPSISRSAIRFMRTRSLRSAREYSWLRLSETNVT